MRLIFLSNALNLISSMALHAGNTPLAINLRKASLVHDDSFLFC